MQSWPVRRPTAVVRCYRKLVADPLGESLANDLHRLLLRGYVFHRKRESKIQRLPPRVSSRDFGHQSDKDLAARVPAAASGSARLASISRGKCPKKSISHVESKPAPSVISCKPEVFSAA